MSKDLIFLNLPDLPNDLEQEVLSFFQSIPVDISVERWQKMFNDYESPIAAHEYGNESTVLPFSLKKKLMDFYWPLFKSPIALIAARLKNLLDAPSCAPPHCDKIRNTAINYLFKTGGNAVTTSWYEEVRSGNNLSLAENKKYGDVVVRSSVIVPERRWHAFDVQRFHSVENIVNERWILSIYLLDNVSYDRFVERYRHLVDFNSDIDYNTNVKENVYE